MNSRKNFGGIDDFFVNQLDNNNNSGNKKSVAYC